MYPKDTTLTCIPASAESAPNNSTIQPRSWCTLRSLVSSTTSASALSGSSISRSRSMLSSRVAPAIGCRRLVPPYRRTSTSVEASRNSTRTRCAVAAKRVERRSDLLLVVAAADHERRSVVRSSRVRDELCQLRDQDGRNVVDDEPAEILEMVGRLRTASPRQPRDHYEIAHGPLQRYRRSSSRHGVVNQSREPVAA